MSPIILAREKRLKFLSIIVLAFISLITEAREMEVEWPNLAALNPSQIEADAREFLLDKKPELANMGVKLVQIDINYFRKTPELTATFVHKNSMKHISQNTTLGSPNPWGINHYMEFVIVSFPLNDGLVEISYNESLLTNDEQESKELFEKYYDDY
jgi:hypothetical protein